MRPTTDLSDDHEDSSSTCATQFRDFGGVRFRPGHWVYCDEDGVLVSATQLK
ncbi:MAG: hypothetical protein OXI11_01385 [Gammaproteobacteria bacterium]|nr:hypothetical protein [Gammaproteobacteria bacterium]MXW46835.1 hypothetical protein [Gammaproteobacteria bacterium]MYD03193.1 hypothetical protein [Gammaproteobacteria bacterium]MYI24271.1 hypothetical protein [Gammaproteobacteria bacterium]